MSLKQYTGSCHCGSVKYKVKLDLEQPVITCNCSMCGRSGSMLAFVPRSELELESAEAELTSYKFNKHVIDHVFCKTCGIKAFAWGTGPDGAATAAVNVRCLEGVDLSTLKTHAYDGKSI